MVGLLDFAVDGICGPVRSNPAPGILASVEAGDFLSGYVPILKLLPMEGVTLVLLAREAVTDWFATYSDNGFAFLKAEWRNRDMVVELVAEPPIYAMENLIWMLSQPMELNGDADFDLEVTFDPGN